MEHEAVEEGKIRGLVEDVVVGNGLVVVNYRGCDWDWSWDCEGFKFVIGDLDKRGNNSRKLV